MLAHILNISNHPILKPGPPVVPITSNRLLLAKINILAIKPNLDIKGNPIITMQLYNNV